MKKKNCAFCGEPMGPADMECKQCGWDSTKVSAPETDPADTRARIFVSIGLIVAYAGMTALINGGGLPASALAESNAPGAPVDSSRAVQEPAIAIGTLARKDTVATNASKKPISIKVADVKNATVLARDAINYPFEVPETSQSCKLIGQVRSSGGDVELMLLTDDQFIFWRANPAAIPHSDWEPVRGSDTPLDYQLTGPGKYYLIVSNALSSTTHRVVQVRAQVKCALEGATASAN